MIYFTQLVFIREGKEEIFHEFENSVLPLLELYGGHLLYRVRPTTGTILHSEVGVPYEIHLISFPSEENLKAYTSDNKRQQYLTLKNDSVQQVLLIRGALV